MNAPTSLHLQATPGRLDSVLSELSGVSRSQIGGWIGQGRVRVDGTPVTRASHKLRGGETIEADVPEPPPSHVEPEDVPLDILFEDDALVAVNKPPGMTTHPAPGVISGTLVNALLGRMTLPAQEGHNEDGSFRPGIVHRLDKDTSGVIVVAKTTPDHARLSEAFRDRATRKTYLAIAIGHWKADRPIDVDAPIGRHPVARQRMAVGGTSFKEAQTRFTPLARLTNPHGQVLTLVQAEPRTGRTHQIRVHLAHLGSPILGDTVYGRASEAMPRHALHAWKLEVPHPRTGEPLQLEAAPPDDLLSAWLALGGELPPVLTGGAAQT
ncbi:RluA family pseudouridine synthase [Deinococcus aquiradiocola]|uniref:Pseudouridine synthase n=1 Tax=Deinococcus aquiradiocola TaxID=393059 RepID=A0A917UKR9_9DEIO|nr:RluA family pseudouridine synthase [Deinococcus aquiradiocola]GGJ64326.1 pseudouridine synthase [Deinococcus aquiradiocola]